MGESLPRDIQRSVRIRRDILLDGVHRDWEVGAPPIFAIPSARLGMTKSCGAQEGRSKVREHAESLASRQ